MRGRSSRNGMSSTRRPRLRPSGVEPRHGSVNFRAVILLDTHAVFWLNQAPERLSSVATRAIRRAAPSTGLALASISLWELARLIEARRFTLRGATTAAFLREIVQTPNLVVLDISPEIAAIAAQSPPGFPKDPADSLIAATALAYDIPVVTKDRAMQEISRIRTIW